MTYVCKSRVIQAPNYSIVKESSADSGVKFRIVHVSALHKTKYFFCIFGNIFIYLRENKAINDYGPFLDFQCSYCQIRITVL